MLDPIVGDAGEKKKGETVTISRRRRGCTGFAAVKPDVNAAVQGLSAGSSSLRSGRGTSCSWFSVPSRWGKWRIYGPGRGLFRFDPV